jgi:D-arabinose 1-dehydrogenase-like Zn-dependent alcohol dehydrogenase
MYIALDADYLTILPDDIDPKVIGPVLCAGVTAYKAVLNANIRAGNWLVVVGAGGGLGHLAGKIVLCQTDDSQLILHQFNTQKPMARWLSESTLAINETSFSDLVLSSSSTSNLPTLCSVFTKSPDWGHTP